MFDLLSALTVEDVVTIVAGVVMTVGMAYAAVYCARTARREAPTDPEGKGSAAIDGLLADGIIVAVADDAAEQLKFEREYEYERDAWQ